jgi:peptide/nickel transport system ATP-binding protein
MDPVLEIRGLRIDVERPEGNAAPIVRDIDLTVNRGEVVALIGESGSGKTTISLAAMGYVRPGLVISEGTVHLAGTDVLALEKGDLRDLRGRRVAYVAQSAAAGFNPSMRIDDQVIEPALEHRLMNRNDAAARALDLYGQLMLPDPEHIGQRFPHQVSGGQLQRLMAAMAMCCGPELLIFDEPTTALDVTTQIDVLKSFKDLVRQRGAAAIYVSHDLAVVAQIADRIIVLLNGEIQEQGSADEIVRRPEHEYTRILMAASDPEIALERWRHDPTEAVPTVPATPKEEISATKTIQDSILNVREVTAGYGGLVADGMPRIPILWDISMDIRRGAVVGVIGESGSGKSTLARVIAGLLPWARGEVRLEGRPLKTSVNTRGRDELRHIQMVFQMADVALNPSHTIGKIVGRPVEYFQRLKGARCRDAVAELLDLVQLPSAFAERKPQELSGGQKQRVNLARALAAKPDIVLCDEVTSSLDSVVRASIIELIHELRQKLGVSFMFISHDISTIASLAEEVVVMYQGRIVEHGPTTQILHAPEHPYTKVLMASVPHLRVGWLEEAIAEREAVLKEAADLKLLD